MPFSLETAHTNPTPQVELQAATMAVSRPIGQKIFAEHWDMINTVAKNTMIQHAKEIKSEGQWLNASNQP